MAFWSGMGGAMFSGAASALGGFMANRQADKAAKRQIAFQREMATHAYQYAMQDMRKAGLNPMLAYQKGGAATPPGASYTPQNILGNAVNSAMAAKRMASEIKNIEADTNKKNEEATTTKALGYKADVDGRNAIRAGKIMDQNLSTAKAAAAEAKIADNFFKTKPGLFFKWVDLMGRSVNPFASSAKSLK